MNEPTFRYKPPSACKKRSAKPLTCRACYCFVLSVHVRSGSYRDVERALSCRVYGSIERRGSSIKHHQMQRMLVVGTYREPTISAKNSFVQATQSVAVPQLLSEEAVPTANVHHQPSPWPTTRPASTDMYSDISQLQCQLAVAPTSVLDMSALLSAAVLLKRTCSHTLTLIAKIAH